MGYHSSVLLTEALSFLKVKPGGTYLDATLGDGGYSLGILQNGGKIVGIDADQESIERTRERFKQKGVDKSDFELIKGNFRNLAELVKDKRFEGIVFDLGVSSNQLDQTGRGFSFSKPATLDMRMDRDLGVRALDLINGLNKGELEKLFEVYGEFKDKRVVKAIIEGRSKKMITQTTELADLIEGVLPKRPNKIHPATLVFQALRIAVNDEINSLRDGLPQAIEVLKSGGRLVVVSFHSLEDRVVKETFKVEEERGRGVVVGDLIRPSLEEIGINPRSRSAKMRIFEKN